MHGLLTRLKRRESLGIRVKKPSCLICGKPCDPQKDKNSDGTHAHYECLRANQAPIPTRKEKRK